MIKPPRDSKEIFVVFLLCKYEMFEEQAPNKVNPTPNNTNKRYKERKQETTETFLFEKDRPSDADFDNPVDKGDQQKDYLDQSALLIKPFCHFFLLLQNSEFIIHQTSNKGNTYLQNIVKYFSAQLALLPRRFKHLPQLPFCLCFAKIYADPSRSTLQSQCCRRGEISLWARSTLPRRLLAARCVAHAR